MESLGDLIRAKLREKGKSFPASSCSDVTPEEYLERRARWDNEAEGHLPGPHCEICRDKGYIAIVKDGSIVHRDCACMEVRRSMARIERSGLKSLLDRYTFEVYETAEKWQETAKNMALRYLDDYEGKWFVAAGVPGSGKTHLCTAICGELMRRGMETRYMLWRRDATKLKASITDADEYERLLWPLKTAKLLYVDDFWKSGTDGKTGRQKVTEGDINLAFDLLNDRYNDPEKVTVISTELNLNQILDIDQAVGSRIYERSKEYFLSLTGQEKNWRLRH